MDIAAAMFGRAVLAASGLQLAKTINYFLARAYAAGKKSNTDIVAVVCLWKKPAQDSI